MCSRRRPLRGGGADTSGKTPCDARFCLWCPCSTDSRHCGAGRPWELRSRIQSAQRPRPFLGTSRLPRDPGSARLLLLLRLRCFCSRLSHSETGKIPVLVPNSPGVSLCRFKDSIHAEFILVRVTVSLPGTAAHPNHSVREPPFCYCVKCRCGHIRILRYARLCLRTPPLVPSSFYY